MIDSAVISDILQNSPSTELLKLKNREVVIVFLLSMFTDHPEAITADRIHSKLADYLEFHQIESDEEDEQEEVQSYDDKAKRYVQQWTNRGFLTNYQNEKGDIYYELSSHSRKTIDWLSALQKEAYVGTESKFKIIFNQIKELVEFTNDDADSRIRLLEAKKRDIEEQIERIKSGEDIKTYEEYEIIPRFNHINYLAKELLSDFKEVEDNFKEITKAIYRKHAENNLPKGDILEYAFGALDELKESSQGKSFYAFWSFLLHPELQLEWDELIDELYTRLEEKNIAIGDFFLRGMKKHLHRSGQKVYEANDKMAEKLSRIIRENQSSKTASTKHIIQDIKKSLLEIRNTGVRPDLSFELETAMEIAMPFERKLTFDKEEAGTYKAAPKLADEHFLNSNSLDKLFSQVSVDKKLLRERITMALAQKSQVTLKDVIEDYGGLEKGLPELFGYLGIAKEHKHVISSEKMQRINFNNAEEKSIQIPEIILTK
ncbi:Protein of unknown function [Arenibacter nanhaiticus]|uniref:Uncharacterized protein n=1 Tax=Arenibacter nanhaiticus TaxID=558155 RepID=A0A1M6KIQ6_9FLAO|nr:DUF3375 domain-containing protein [Arenibacter nanhaiticus]SHJ58785.1 Protein of unknown function [Arenibacter nanhaiticus]